MGDEHDSLGDDSDSSDDDDDSLGDDSDSSDDDNDSLGDDSDSFDDNDDSLGGDSDCLRDDNDSFGHDKQTYWCRIRQCLHVLHSRLSCPDICHKSHPASHSVWLANKLTQL